MAAAQAGSRWRRLARAGAALALVAWPILAWCGLSAWSARAVALVLLALLVPAALLRDRRAGARTSPIAFLPVIGVVLVGLGALLGESGFVVMVPVAINATLLVAFGASLRQGATPMVEAFARLQEPELDAQQRSWCRLWTRIWCGFFVVNGSVAALLAWLAPLSWWALYNGLIAYLAMGVLFAVEWTLRVRRFPRRATREQLPDEAP